MVVGDDTHLLDLARTDRFCVVRESGGTAVKLLWSIVSVLAARLRETPQLGGARERSVADDLTAQPFGEYPTPVRDDRDTMPAIPRGATFPRWWAPW